MGIEARTRQRAEGCGACSVRAVSPASAPDDIVDTHAEAEANTRPPLLVLEPLREFLDAHDLGAGAITASRSARATPT